MATYKVPQDVEADDKLLGPFSFRQFIYLIIAVMGGALAYGLAQLFVPLAIIPLPVVILFGILALPLRKDQPMEVYLAAVLSFYLKPRKRLWKADGIQSLVEIIAPKFIEEHRTNGLSEMEAEKRLSYLANLVDSRGWAVRGVGIAPQSDNAMQDSVFFAAQQTEDVLDDTSTVTHTFDNMIDRADAKRRQDAMNIISKPTPPVQIPAIPDPYASLAPPVASQPSASSVQNDNQHIAFNPYPTAMHQSVILPPSDAPAQSIQQPQSTQIPQPAPATSNDLVSPDIINLANNSDLSIETIAHEAKRIREKEEKTDGEVLISLR